MWQNFISNINLHQKFEKKPVINFAEARDCFEQFDMRWGFPLDVLIFCVWKYNFSIAVVDYHFEKITHLVLPLAMTTFGHYCFQGLKQFPTIYWNAISYYPGRQVLHQLLLCHCCFPHECLNRMSGYRNHSDTQRPLMFHQGMDQSSTPTWYWTE